MAIVSPWAKPGAWALDSEENEADLLQQQVSAPVEDVSAVDFPSLAAAAATKPKKKKGQTISLAEFTASGSAHSKPAGLTHEDLLALPTGPRERSAEELDRNRLGGGFRSYGLGRYGDDSSNSRRGGFDDSRGREPLAPSRADEIDDWGATKKSMSNGFDRRERGGDLFSSHSKADESDNWGSNKSSEPRFSSGGGADFNRERRGFRGGYEGLSNGSGADSDRWGKKREDEGLSNGSRSDSDRWGKRREDESSFGNSSARPKLVLQPRTLPVNEASGGLGSVKPKGANPFGDARPREEVLKEKGQDWKEIYEKLESVKIKEAERGEKGGGSFGKRSSFGSGSSRVSRQEVRTERSWRKNDSEPVEAATASPSAEKDENAGEETSPVEA